MFCTTEVFYDVITRLALLTRQSWAQEIGGLSQAVIQRLEAHNQIPSVRRTKTHAECNFDYGIRHELSTGAMRYNLYAKNLKLHSEVIAWNF